MVLDWSQVHIAAGGQGDETDRLGLIARQPCSHCPPNNKAWRAPAPGRPFQVTACGIRPQWMPDGLCISDVGCGEAAQNKQVQHTSECPFRCPPPPPPAPLPACALLRPRA